MKALALAALAAAAACAGPSLEQEVPKGSTPQEVERLLGKPDGRTERFDGGRTQEVWIYGSLRRNPSVPRHAQLATPQGGPLYGTTRPAAPPPAASYRELLRVVFENGRVVAVEKALRAPGPP